MARNEDAIRRRIEERIAFVQAHPGMSKAEAREQFYVETRAAELEAQGQKVNRAALRQKFRSGQVSREGFYVQGEQERLRSSAARISNEVTSNTGVVPPPGTDGRAVDNGRSGGSTLNPSVPRRGTYGGGAVRGGYANPYQTPDQIAKRTGMDAYQDYYGNTRYHKAGFTGQVAQVSNQLGSYLDVEVVKPVGGIVSGTFGSLKRVSREFLGANMAQRALNKWGPDSMKKEVQTPTPMDVLVVGSLFAGARGGNSAYTTATGESVTAAELAAQRGLLSRGLSRTRVGEAVVSGTERLRAGISGKAAKPMYGPTRADIPSPNFYGQLESEAAAAAAAKLPNPFYEQFAPGATAPKTPTPTAPSVGAAPVGPSRPTSTFYDDFVNPKPPTTTPAATPEPMAQPGGAASKAIEELRATTQNLIDEANAPTPTPSRGRGGRGKGATKTETTAPAASAADDAAQAQLQAGKTRLKELKKELAQAKKMGDADGAAGVVDQIQRDIAKVEADLSKLKTNLGRPAKATTQTEPAKTVTSGTVPTPTPEPTPAPARPAGGGRSGGRSGGRGGTSRPATTTPETAAPATPARPAATQPETVPPASSTSSRSTSRATDATPRTANVNDEAALDSLWKWSKENAAARKAGTLGPRPADWKPASQQGVDVAIPKNEPVKIEIDPARAQKLARQEAESIATQRQASQQFRESERLRAQAGNLRTQQRGSRTQYRNLEERLRALQDDLAASGGADPVLQKRIASLQKQIAAARTKRAQVLGEQRTTQAQARQLENQARGLQEQRLDYVGRPEGGPRMDQTQGRRTATSVAEESRQANTSKWFDDENIRDPYAED